MSVVLLSIALGLLIGAVLGGLGGGGAILTVPALVYVVGQSAQEATASSLVIVGLTALVGTAPYVRAGRVRWRVALSFAAIGLPATWVGALANRRVDPDVLLLAFAGLMVVAAAAMLADRRSRRPGPPVLLDDEMAPGSRSAVTPVPASSSTAPSPSGDVLVAAPLPLEAERTAPTWAVVLVAAVVGLLTGFLGVGGGFVIVPALVLVLGLPMEFAVGTSLAIIGFNSATALASRWGSAHLDLQVVVPFAVAAMSATLLGKRVADRLPARRLQVAFALLMIAIALYTAAQVRIG